MAGSYATYTNVKTRLGLDDDTDQTFITQLCTNANEWIEEYCRTTFSATSGGTATFDADYDVYDDALYVRDGVRSITSATVAPATGETAVSATVADLIILPRSQNRKPGWPGHWVIFKDTVAGSVSDWGTGQANITLVYDNSWASVPAVITEIAEIMVVRAWHGRNTGQTDIIGSDETGAPIVSRYLSSKDRETLRGYRPDRLVVG